MADKLICRMALRENTLLLGRKRCAELLESQLEGRDIYDSTTVACQQDHRTRLSMFITSLSLSSSQRALGMLLMLRNDEVGRFSSMKMGSMNVSLLDISRARRHRVRLSTVAFYFGEAGRSSNRSLPAHIAPSLSHSHHRLKD